MTVEPLVPDHSASGGMRDVPLGGDDAVSEFSPGTESFSGILGMAFAATSASLARAEHSERAFAAGRGGLQEMVLQRAQADVALSLASAAASRTSQALSTILGMQV